MTRRTNLDKPTRMKSGFGVIRLIVSLLWISPLGWIPAKGGTLDGSVETQLFQYASEDAPTFYLSNKTNYETPEFESSIELYYESGPRGAWSFDPDPIRYHAALDDPKKTEIWLGRGHPLDLIRKSRVEPTSALGTVWTQDQLNALAPKVSGWLGGGVIHEWAPGWKSTFAYSPIFLPTFSPSLGFTQRGDLNPARFARLPPSGVNTGGVTLPIRYQLRVDQLSELLFRHQAFLGIAKTGESADFELYAYTAPKPDPVPITDATLAVSQNEVNAHVSINPQFPREYWAGTRVQSKETLFKPALEFIQNLEDFSNHLVSLTGYYGTQANFGLLTHLKKNTDSARFSDFLVFLKIPTPLTNRITLQSLIESTLLSTRKSLYCMEELQYWITKTFSVLIGLRVLAGEDDSFFGAWRNQSSLSIGVLQKW